MAKKGKAKVSYYKGWKLTRNYAVLAEHGWESVIFKNEREARWFIRSWS